MKYLSVCSGIEAATVAWHSLGWQAAAYSEIEPFPSAVLAHHFPDVPNVGDMTKYKEWNIEPGSIDLLVGGTPCQSFSVAGLRKGLADPRGNLALVYCGILDHLKPRWFVWENVPGVLSSGGGRDFGSFLGAVAELGYGFAYRVLDAQYFGVAQRRRRVFVVGYLGDWRPAAKVLFEPESLRRDTAPSRETGQSTAATLDARTKGGGFPGTDGAAGGHVVPVCPTLRAGGNRTGGDRPPGTDVDTADSLIPICIFQDSEYGTGRGTPLVPVGVTIHGTDPTVQKVASYDDLAQCLRARTPGNIDNSSTTVVQQPVGIFQDSEFGVAQYDSAGTLRAGRIPEHQMVMQPVAFHPTQDPISSADVCHSIGANDNATAAVAFQQTADCLTAAYGTKWNGNASATNGSLFAAVAVRTANTGANGHGFANEVTHTLDRAQGQAVIAAMQVRRLTPVECERLQGFPDDYTAIPWRKKPASECPDGPRYKALGNSMAVPVMAWIGRRINEQEA